MPENNAQQTTEVETVSVTPETAREKFEREQQARRQGLRKFGITSGFLSFAAKPKPQTPTAEPATPGADWKDFEEGQVSRRAALRKMGITSAMTVFALFSVDDLARMVGKEMERRAKDNQIAEVVARELRDAGVAAAYPPSSPCYNCLSGDQCHPGTYQDCQPCCAGCSCVQLVNTPCSDYTATGGSAACRACCLAQNPPGTNPMATPAYSLCTQQCGPMTGP